MGHRAGSKGILLGPLGLEGFREREFLDVIKFLIGVGSLKRQQAFRFMDHAFRIEVCHI